MQYSCDSVQFFTIGTYICINQGGPILYICTNYAQGKITIQNNGCTLGKVVIKSQYHEDCVECALSKSPSANILQKSDS